MSSWKKPSILLYKGMRGFRDWLLTEEAIPAGAIKVDLPDIRQQKDYTCGSAALMAIAKLHGVGPDKEKQFEKLLKSNSESGTDPENIIKIGKKLGLNPVAKVGMTLKQLMGHLDKKRPVICTMQAWGEPDNYHNSEDGHYVVAIGYTKDRIYFEDPSLEGLRGYLNYDEFDKRWHDVDSHGHDCRHLGIVFRESPHKAKEKTPSHATKIK
jgi:predicted double-glycine peptidase